MWESIRDWAFGELREVKRAPTAFGASLVLGLGIAWWAAGVFYAERIAVMEQRIAALDDGAQQIASAVKASDLSVWTQPLTVALCLALAAALAAILRATINRRRADRLDGELRRSQVNVTLLEYRMNEGDLNVGVHTLGKPLPLLKELGKVFWRDVVPESDIRLCSPLELAREHQAFVSASEELITERDAAVKALKDRSEEFGQQWLQLHGGMRFHGDVAPVVTIRSATYDDYALVQKIDEIFTKFTGWKVVRDGKNDPMLPLAGKFRVVFEHCGSLAFERVATAFVVGDLLDGLAVGTKLSDRTDQHHLVVEIMPSA